nr:hypothetical protein Iba_chr02cCG11860 [Ipomoea batatas]
MTCWVLRPFFGKANRGAADEFSANKETTDGDGLGSSATGFGCFSLFAGLAIGGSGLLCLGWERGGVAPERNELPEVGFRAAVAIPEWHSRERSWGLDRNDQVSAETTSFHPALFFRSCHWRMAADENEFCHQEHMVAQTLHRIDFDHQLSLKHALHYLVCPFAPSHSWSHEPNHQMAHWFCCQGNFSQAQIWTQSSLHSHFVGRRHPLLHQEYWSRNQTGWEDWIFLPPVDFLKNQQSHQGSLFPHLFDPLPSVPSALAFSVFSSPITQFACSYF